jgi:iron complex transport system ATP-binding protein
MVDVEVRDVHFSYSTQDVLKGISFKAKPGEITAIIGPNGAGKSTLLKIIAGLLKPKIGSVLLNGVDIAEMSRDERVKIVSYLPQENVIPGILTVYEVVLLGRIPYLSWKVKDEDLRITEKFLRDLGLEKYAKRFAHQLSGGERQMVLIAQALVREPKVLLLDEPVSNLDIKNQLEILDLIRKITVAKGITTIVILHDLNLASRFADKLVVLNNGSLYAFGTPMEVLTPEMLAKVYGVEAKVLIDSGCPQVSIIRSLNRSPQLASVK